MKELGFDFDVPELNDDQIDNWRNILLTLPLPPMDRALGSYALIMPRHDIEILVGKMQSYIDKYAGEETKEKWESSGLVSGTSNSNNLIRTRPRDPNKRVRPY